MNMDTWLREKNKNLRISRGCAEKDTICILIHKYHWRWYLYLNNKASIYIFSNIFNNYISKFVITYHVQNSPCMFPIFYRYFYLNQDSNMKNKLCNSSCRNPKKYCLIGCNQVVPLKKNKMSKQICKWLCFTYSLKTPNVFINDFYVSFTGI